VQIRTSKSCGLLGSLIVWSSREYKSDGVVGTEQTVGVRSRKSHSDGVGVQTDGVQGQKVLCRWNGE